MTRRFEMDEVRIALCGKDKIPADFSVESKVITVTGSKPFRSHITGEVGTIQLGRAGTFTFRVKPSPVRGPGSKSSEHRVFVECPTCGVSIPAGRLHQHEGSGICCSTRDKKLSQIEARLPDNFHEMREVDPAGVAAGV